VSRHGDSNEDDERDDYEKPEFDRADRPERGPKEKKKFLSSTMDVGQILTIGSIVASMIGGYYSFDSRLALIERQIGRQTQVIELSIRQDEQLKYLVERVGKIEQHLTDVKK
jgi:uncharacterized coiled-coil protein SlyX